ncbi:MAG: hypothetical protein Q7R41_11700 [Phycisphaerales bacterium]|nr:hypothetical protein [Phycisphaerales bacterium]
MIARIVFLFVHGFLMVLFTGSATNAQVRYQTQVENTTDQDSGRPNRSVVTDADARIASGSPKVRNMCGDGHCDVATAETFGTCPRDCRTLNDRADYLRGLLQSRFASVEEGVFAIFEADHCADVPLCFYNNPTSPYGRLLFRLAPGEPDPDPANLHGIPKGMEDLYAIYRVRPGEALVWIGRTPPECPYFSFTGYVFSRFDPEARGNPPYGDRTPIFASLGDSENQLTMKTNAQPGESPFDRESVVIVTADRNVDRAIRSGLVRAGLSESMTNTLVLPRFKADGVTPKIQMGYENDADIFTVVMRIAGPDALQPGTAIRAWLDNPGSRVFRIRPADTFPLDPFPLPALRPQGNGVSEDGESLDQLVRSIQNAYGDVRTEVQTAWPVPTANGDYCLDHLSECGGDCRDTPYMAAKFRLGAEPEAIIVAGRNHENSNKASYVNITAARVVGQTAYYSIVMDELEGSTDVYLPDHPDAENLWQMKFARNCHGEPYCFELTAEQIPIGGLVAILVRAYLDPSTGTSPKVFPIEESELAFPRVIKVN